MIEAVPPERVAFVWADAEAALRKACDRLGERNTHDVLVQLVTGNAQLWNLGTAWAVTEIATYPRKRVAILTLLGGAFPKHQVREMRDMLHQWARHYRADEIRIIGRRGWLRYLPEMQESTVLTTCLQYPPATCPE
jgi:hypothetical protein